MEKQGKQQGKQIDRVFVSGVLTCKSGLAQIEGKDERNEKKLLLKHRTDSYLVQKKMWVEDPEKERKFYEAVEGERMIGRIPAPSSNTLRAKIRDVLAYDILKKIGGSAGLKTTFFLFGGGGGFDGKNEKKGATVDLIERIRVKNVVAGLLGGSVGGAIIPGKLVSGIPILYCSDLADYLPKGIIDETGEEMPTDPASLPDARSFLVEKMFTRHDDINFSEVRELLSDEAKKEYAEEEYSKEKEKSQKGKQNGTSDPEAEEKKEVRRQAIYTIETVAAGAKYYSHFFLRGPQWKELGGFLKAFRLFSRDPYIGGMSSKGLGEVSLAYRVTAFFTDGTAEEGTFKVNVDHGPDASQPERFVMDDSRNGFMQAAIDSYEEWLSNITLDDINVDNL